MKSLNEYITVDESRQGMVTVENKMSEYTLKGLIDKLTSIYKKYGDIKVYKDDDCGGALSIYPELIEVEEWRDKEGNVIKYVKL